MARPTWVGLREQLGITSDQLATYREHETAPETPHLAKWQDWLASPDAPASGASNAYAQYLPGKCSYDKAIENGYTEQRAKIREQVIGEEIANKKNRLELEKVKGKLIPKEEADADFEWLMSVFTKCVKNMPESLKSGIAPDIQRSLLANWGKASKEILNKVATTIRAERD